MDAGQTDFLKSKLFFINSGYVNFSEKLAVSAELPIFFYLFKKFLELLGVSMLYKEN